MFPSQTSLIPVQVALARFLTNQGWQAAFKPYPYWYLGTTPFRYLTGPILPGILVFFSRLTNCSLFETMFGLIALSWLFGSFGLYLLVKELGDRKVAFWAALFFLFAPIMIFLFRFSDGLSIITFSFLPFVFLLVLKLLKNGDKKSTIFCILAISFVILLDTSILPSLLLGLSALFLVEVGWKKAERKLRRLLLVLGLALFLATFWYGLGYWWVLLKAPSFAGKPLAGVIFWLSNVLPTALAFGLAVISVRFFKTKSKIRDFAFYWLFVFVLLTLIRFLSDYDFWLDWSAYGLEIQMGLALIFGLIFKRIESFWLRSLLFCFDILIFALVLKNNVLGTLPKDITKTVEYRIGQKLLQIVKPKEKVFLSGTTAFWLNAFFDIVQIRGGVDQASVDSQWRQAVWEIREGDQVEKSISWLKKLNISYLVVHTQNSAEYYHDFKNIQKFEQCVDLLKIYDQSGDRIYRVLQNGQ